MRKWLAAVLGLLGVSPLALADTGPTELVTSKPADDIADQGVGVDLGIAGGNSFTPGGLRVGGHYLYQLSSQDWFDGTASFTYGGNGTGCMVDTTATTSCEHGLVSGRGVEIVASVRRMFAARGAFRPFARVGLGVGIVHYASDDLTGFTLPVHLGGGLRARVSPSIAVVTQAEVQAGIGGFTRDLGAEAQLGLAVTAGAEFELR